MTKPLKVSDRIRVGVSGRQGTVERVFRLLPTDPEWRARVQMDGDPLDRTIVYLADDLERIDAEMDKSPRPDDRAPDDHVRPPAHHAVDRNAAEHPPTPAAAPVAPVAVAAVEAVIVTIVMTDGSRRSGYVVWSDA